MPDSATSRGSPSPVSATVLSALWLTLKIATLATLLAFAVALPLARWLAHRDGIAARLIYISLSLPMVLPPTAVGFVLLQLLAVDGPTGTTVLGLPASWLLTWQAAVIAAGVMAFPIVLRTAKAAFEQVDPRLQEVSRTLGHSPLQTFLGTVLPLASRGLSAAAIMGFTRAASEFGATVTVAGNIPFQTQTLASAIYAAQQVGKDTDAAILIGVALALGFAALATAEWLISRSQNRRSS
ncbi:MAG: ABC transporter permease subunit [Pseudomonadota bacterium]